MEDSKNQLKSVKSKITSFILGIVGLLLVVLIIGIGALLASHEWNPPWNPFKKVSASDTTIREKILQEIKQ